MEILNNFWNAISTPNEGLINVLSVPLMFVEITLVLYIFLYLQNIKATKTQKVTFVILQSLEGLISLNLLPAPYNSFVNYIIMILMFYFIFKISILKSLIAVIIPTLILVLIGTSTLNPFVKIVQMDFEIARIIPIYRLSYALINYLMLFLITLIIKNKNIYLNILDEFDKKTKFILIVSFILGLFVLAIQTYVSQYYTNNLPIIITTLSFLSLIAYLGISIYTLTRVVKLMLTTKQLENAEEYNKTLQILHDNVRCFKHDYDNTVAALGGYIKTNDMEGLKKYYKELEEEVIKVSMLYMLNPNLINNPRNI